MLTLKDIRIRFEDILIYPCTICIPERCITLIRGVSGSGKTSLLYRIGLISGDGSYGYLAEGKDLVKVKESEKSMFRQKRLSFVLQDNSLFEQYDVMGNLRIYAMFNGKSYSEEEYLSFLESVNLHIPLNQGIDTLSGGERQRLAIACCLCKDTDIIILDEPTSFLDEKNEINVFEVLKRVARQYRKTIIITSHSQNALAIADEIYEIKDKKLHEIKHCDEKDVINNGYSSKTRIFPLCISYVEYFLKKYIKIEFLTTILLVFMMSLMSVLMIYTEFSQNKSIASFKKLSENQLLVKKANGEPFTLDVDSAIAYPYFDTTIRINGNYLPVVPYFKENDFQGYVIKSYGDEGVYVSFQVYNDMQGMGINLENGKAVFQIYDGGRVFEDETEYGIGGILKIGTESKYLPKGTTRFAYCDYETLRTLYKKYGLLRKDAFSGYTIFTDTFETYLSLSSQLQKKGYEVTVFFDSIEEIFHLEEMGKQNMRMIMSMTFLLTIALLTMVEIMYFKKRNKEMMMLKLNGIQNRHIFIIVITDILIQIFFASLLVIVFLYMMRHFTEFSLLKYMRIILTFIILAMIIEMAVLYPFIRCISIEKVLRDQEKGR